MKYQTMVTEVGAAKLRDAALLETPLRITQVEFGDGGGQEYTPTGAETALKNTRYRTAPSRIEREGSAPSWVELEAVIPFDVGEFYLREVGLFDDTNALIFIGNLPSSYKPAKGEGVIKDLVFELIFDALATDTIELSINPSANYATRAYVDTLISSLQFQPYHPSRVYKTGEICTTEQNGRLSYWQWYSNLESLAGRSPLELSNRHDGWTHSDKPFYWIPYTGEQVGVPVWWLQESAPEWAVMEMGQDLNIKVYWRLAEIYPDLVSGDYINTGDIRGEFLRVWSGSRSGLDTDRELNSWQNSSAFVGDGDGNNIAIPNLNDSLHKKVLGFELDAPSDPREEIAMRYSSSIGSHKTSGVPLNGKASGGTDFARSRVRNYARAMVITI